MLNGGDSTKGPAKEKQFYRATSHRVIVSIKLNPKKNIKQKMIVW